MTPPDPSHHANDHATNAHLFHRELAHFNAQRLLPGLPSSSWRAQLQTELGFKLAEGHYLEALRAEVARWLPPADSDADDFVAWFEALQANGPGQQHSLFDWLAEMATLDDMRWFLAQEAAGEAGFDDLVAYAQVKLPTQAKLECARNYWDEMGHGKQAAMHGQLLDRMVHDMQLEPRIDTTVWQALALGNTMIGLATNRRYAHHALGALGAIELTAPGRVKKVAAGMKRLGLDARMRAYFDLHGALDVSHAACWLREVIRPMAASHPDAAKAMAEGALMRLLCGEQCFDRYSSHLRATPKPAGAAQRTVKPPQCVPG